MGVSQIPEVQRDEKCVTYIVQLLGRCESLDIN